MLVRKQHAHNTAGIEEKRGRTAVASLLLGMSFALGAAQAAPPMIDAHGHYTAADAASLAPEAVVAKLDAAGVHRLVVSGISPELAQRLYRHAPARMIPLLGVYRAETDKAIWMQDTTLPARVEATLAQGAWAGIGELHLFAADARTPVFERLVGLADRHGLVLMIHGDAEVVAHAFALAPRLRVLWAHLGTEPEPALLEQMIARYPEQLWIDTSVRDERIAPEGRLLPAWRALFERHPQRFVVAVDTFSVNRWHGYEQVVRQIRGWVDALPQALQDNLLRANAQRLFDRFPR
jgi:hypothetical protein